MKRGAFNVLGVCSLACAAVSRPPALQEVPRRAPVASLTHVAASLPVVVPSTTAPAALAAEDLAITRVLSLPVTSIALGEGTRLAVLADPPHVGDARGLKAIPLPLALRAKPGEVDHLAIFFGRDNEPRIMGSRSTDHGDVAIYFRHLAAGWRDGREEIGQLGGARLGALWGVLGTADPELVCRANAVCIIKRTTGWSTAPAGAVPRVVTLQDGVLWGLDASGVARIDAKGWALSMPAPAWSEPTALWAIPGEAWVSTPSALFHYQAGRWQASASPVGSVTAWWGTRADSLWLAGSDGAAHFDGRVFRTVAIPGPLHAVRGLRNAEVWFGGEAGLFCARPCCS